MSAHKHEWRRAILHSLPITLLISGLFFYWFAVVDRFVIFLYGHLGAMPFNAVTNGRYWMSGLVAGGIVMVLYTSVHVLIGQMRAEYKPPSWWRVWLFAAVPLAVIIPAITMTMNQPVLPGGMSVMVTAVALLALALALPPATIAVHSLAQFGWLLLAGLGITSVLITLRAIELPQQGLVSPRVAWTVGLGLSLAGIIWTLAIAWVYMRRHQTPWKAPALFIAGLQISYLLLPLTHYLFMTPSRYRYISSSQNFFAFNPILQITTWGIAILVCLTAVVLQKKWYLSRN